MGLVKYFWAEVWCEGVKIEVVQASVMCYQPPKELIFVAITQTQSGPRPKEEARGGRISHFYSQGYQELSRKSEENKSFKT